MHSKGIPEEVQGAYPSFYTCTGPCAGYRSRLSCPPLLVLATLAKEKEDIVRCLEKKNTIWSSDVLGMIFSR